MVDKQHLQCSQAALVSLISSWFFSKLVMLCNYMPGSHFWDLFSNTTTRSFYRQKSEGPQCQKRKDMTSPNSLCSLQSSNVSLSALYLLDTPLSSQACGPAEKCKFNCQGTFSLAWAPSKERTVFKHFVQGIHGVVQASKSHFGPRGALVPLCWGALGHSMPEGQKLFIATASFSCTSAECGEDGTALSRLSAASCFLAQKI